MLLWEFEICLEEMIYIKDYFRRRRKITMLTQSEADALFEMPKKPKSGNGMAFPHAGGKLLAEFVSLDSRE